MYDQKSGLQFLQRNGLAADGFAPRARCEPESLLIRDLESESATPLAALLQHLDGEPPPDRYQAQTFP